MGEKGERGLKGDRGEEGQMGLRGLRGEPGGERNGGRQIAQNITTTTNIVLAVCGIIGVIMAGLKL